MSNLILCTGKKAKNPFQMEEVGVAVYTIEEFCYQILKNPDDMDGSIYSPAFVHFVRVELQMEELADALDEILVKKKGYTAFIMEVLNSNHYAGREDLRRMSERLKSLENKSPIELEKLRADKLLEKKRLQAAIQRYETIIERESFTDNVLLGNIYNNLGSAYARLFLYEKAAECFRSAYRLNRNMVSYHSYLHAIRYVASDAEYGRDVIFLEDEQAKALEKEMTELFASAEASVDGEKTRVLKHLQQEGQREDLRKELNRRIMIAKREYMDSMGEEL